MSNKKEEVANLLVAAAFDASLRKLNAQLASRHTPDQDLPEFSATKMRSI